MKPSVLTKNHCVLKTLFYSPFINFRDRFVNCVAPTINCAGKKLCGSDRGFSWMVVRALGRLNLN